MENDLKTVVIIPIEYAESAFAAQEIASNIFKVKAADLHVRPGISNGDDVELLTGLNQKPDVWMVWR